MKQPAASPGRAEKPPPQQQLPAPPGLARLLLSKSRRGARSRRAPAASPMFVSRPGRSRAGADGGGEPSSPKVTCIGQVRMRNKGKKKKKMGAAAAPEKVSAARGYCRCLKKAFLCGGLFGGYFDDRRRGHHKAAPEPERGRRSPWVFSSRDVAVAAAPKQQPDPSRDGAGEEEEEGEMGVFGSVERDERETDQPGIDGDDKEGGEEEKAAAAEEDALVSSSAPPKNALLLMRCRSAPQNRSSPLTARFAAAPSPNQDAVEIAAAATARASPSPAPSPRKAEKAAAVGREDDTWLDLEALPLPVAREQEEELCGEEHEDEEEEEEEEEMRCSSARPLVLPRCKSEPATTAAAKMAAGADAEATPSGCFWANGGGSGRRRHAPPSFAAPVALTGH